MSWERDEPRKVWSWREPDTGVVSAQVSDVQMQNASYRVSLMWRSCIRSGRLPSLGMTKLAISFQWLDEDMARPWPGRLVQ